MRKGFIVRRAQLLFRWLSPVLGLALVLSAAQAAETEDDIEVALSLADMLRSARVVISESQDLINDPAIGDKGLTSEVVLSKALDAYRRRTGRDPLGVDPKSRHGRLLEAQMAAIREVVDEHQETINRPGVGFKGFVPAVFARLVNERFMQKVGDEAEIKVTAPPELVRNRKALPDTWETQVIQRRLMSPDWPQGQVFYTEAESRGLEAFRALIPEYYEAGCLSCHGEPKGEIDVTGYPKEGGELGELGGVISITLYR